MRTDYYNQYIQSPEWRAKADEAKKRAGYRCQVCNRPSSIVTLHAHHRTYERLGHERPEDITVLCEDCHKLFHENKTNSRIPSHSMGSTHDPEPRKLPVYIAEHSSTVKRPKPVEPSGPQKSDALYGKVVLASLVVAFVILGWAASVLKSDTTAIQASETPRDALLTKDDGIRLFRSVTTAKANLHRGPGTDYPVLKTLDAGIVINVVGYHTADIGNRNMVWYLLAEGDWVSEDYIHAPTIGVPEVSSRATDTLILRSEYVQLAKTPIRKVRPTNTPRPRPTPASTATSVSVGCAGGCTQYPAWCAPPIKGNVSYNSGEKIYHVPGQEYYANTKISPGYGERWFCTEAEARQAGWRKSKK